MSFFEKLRRMSWSGDTKDSDLGVSPPRTNVWSSTFDPGRNANLKGGRSYYDSPTDGKTTWDQVVASERSSAEYQRNSDDLARAAFGSAAGGKNSIDASDLRKMLEPERVESLMKMADRNGDGRIDFDEFVSFLRQQN